MLSDRRSSGRVVALILGVLQGLPKETLLAGVFEPFPGAWDDAPLAPVIAAIAAGSFKRAAASRLSGTGGYVVTVSGEPKANSRRRPFPTSPS